MTTPMEDCIHWIKEREKVRLLKTMGAPYPWTDDPIISKYRFCNVRREDDRVTKWIDEHIRLPFAGHERLWLMCCIARQINWPDTLAELIRTPGAWPIDVTFNPSIMGDVLDYRAEHGEKVFTGAYIITAPATKGAKKTRHIAEKVIGQLWRDRLRFDYLWSNRQPRMEEVHAKLRQYDGWGPFLAYQAVVDMRFTPLLKDAEDRDRWAAAGPGTIRGLNRLAGRRLDLALDQGRALQELRKLWPILQERSGVNMDFSDVPNVMCETDKYLRAKNGEGKPRALYVPGRGS